MNKPCEQEARSFNDKMTESGYGFISQEVMRDKGLSRNAKAVYAYLCGFAGKGGECHPSRELMSDELDVSKTTLTAYIRELTDRNYITLFTDGREDGRFTRTKYLITHLHRGGGEDEPENNAESVQEERGTDSGLSSADRKCAGSDSSEYRACHKSGMSDGAYADRFPAELTTENEHDTVYGSAVHGSAVHGSAVHGSAVHGSAVHGSAALGSDSRAINNILNNKYNNKKNNTFKNNTFKNTTFKNNSFKKNRKAINKSIKNRQDIDDYLSAMPPCRLRASLEAYVDMRSEMDKPVLFTSFKAMLKQLRAYSEDDDVQADILDRSVVNSWTGIYPPEQKKDSGGGNVFLKIVNNGEL